MQGGEAFNSGDYAKAIEVFSKGYSASQTNTQLAIYLAQSYDRVDSLAKAIEIYRGVMALTHSRYAADVEKAKGELTTMLLARAAAAAGENNLDAVVEYTGDILAFDPQNADATLLRVQVANNAQNYAKVIEYGPAAAEAQTDAVKKSTAYFLLGAAYQNLDNKTKAIEAFKNVTTGDNAAQAKKLIADLSK
jgi:tetratricopeptide (TPR) repeat protein